MKRPMTAAELIAKIRLYNPGRVLVQHATGHYVGEVLADGSIVPVAGLTITGDWAQLSGYMNCNGVTYPDPKGWTK